MENVKKLAVLIDADNTSPNMVQALFEEVAKYGVASVKRIYGDWSSQTLIGWQKVLLEYAIVPVQQFAYTKGKDATDMILIIDAMDLLYSRTFDGFCIVSSDSDFTPLASRIRANGVTVYGVGRRNTPQAFRSACDKFIYSDNLAAENEHSDNAINASENASTTKEKEPIEGALRHLLNKAVKDTTNDETGWASLGQIGSYLSQTQSDFDPRNYGYSKLSSMLKDHGGLQLRTDGSLMRCRKIPYGEVIKYLDEAIAKFQDKNGSAAIDAVEKYVKPRFLYNEYGFADFDTFVDTVHAIERQDDRIRLVKKESKV